MAYRREAILSATAAAVASVGGCVQEPADSTPGKRSTEEIQTTFETGVDTAIETADDPIVSFKAGEIVVIGTYAIGNYCYNPTLAEPAYDEAADRLEIRVTREHVGSTECEDINQEISYRAVVTFDGQPPETVHVIENDGGETTRSRPH
ncbi:hypothetical protein [Halovivax limisalsi]|uniref:hypothetical protein n=1 Tax=Halovivax limisalsi TaxID=1453760 RepID=UPI001FFDA46C|nr:hypothetical protein [Halovivax limisalsi]